MNRGASLRAERVLQLWRNNHISRGNRVPFGYFFFQNCNETLQEGKLTDGPAVH